MTRLSLRDQAIIKDVNRFRQMTSGQIERLYFRDGSPKTSSAKMCRTMKRLYGWGLVGRINRAVGGWSGGSDGFTYTPVSSKARASDAHTLDIAELYVGLVGAGCKLLAFEPEAWAQLRIGQVELKPDAYVELAKGEYVDPYFAEVDRGTEFASQLSSKMRRYTQAFNRWDVDKHGPSFPVVLWIVPDEARARFMHRVVIRQEVPALFEIVTMDKAVAFLTAA